MPKEVRRGSDLDELEDLVDKEGKFDFSTLFTRYEIGYKNPISVELLGK